MMLSKKANIRLQHVKIGERLLVVGEVRSVIPYIEQRGDRLPRFNVFTEPAVLAGVARGQRMGKATFNRAKPHDHILAGPNSLRRAAGVLISKSVDANLREVRFDILCYRVHK